MCSVFFRLLFAIGGYFACHFMRSCLAPGQEAGWFRGMVDAWAWEANLVNRILPFWSPPFGSVSDVLYPLHSTGYAVFFWMGAIGGMLTLAGQILMARLKG